MNIEPIDKSLQKFFHHKFFLRALLYHVLDWLLTRSWHIHREVKIWARNHPQSSHILDAGTGFGQNSYFLSRLSEKYSILSVDIQERQICDCNEFFRRLKKQNVYFKTVDIREFDQPKAFDLILCTNVLNYIEDDVSLLSRFHNNLDDDGILLLANPSDSAYIDIANQSPDGVNGLEFARTGYTMTELKDKVREAGFSKVKARYAYGKTGVLAWKLAIGLPTTMVKTSKLFYILFPVYFAIALPIITVLNYYDAHVGHTSGKAIIAKAWK